MQPAWSFVVQLLTSSPLSRCNINRQIKKYRGEGVHIVNNDLITVQQHKVGNL